jgi:hypothetical protein
MEKTIGGTDDRDAAFPVMNAIDMKVKAAEKANGSIPYPVFWRVIRNDPIPENARERRYRPVEKMIQVTSAHPRSDRNVMEYWVKGSVTGGDSTTAPMKLLTLPRDTTIKGQKNPAFSRETWAKNVSGCRNRSFMDPTIVNSIGLL